MYLKKNLLAAFHKILRFFQDSTKNKQCFVKSGKIVENLPAVSSAAKTSKYILPVKIS